jgi:hypothetical protein
MDWFKRLISERATDWYFEPLEQGDPIAADSSYINIFLRSLHIRDVRRGLKRFTGAVHSFIEVSQLGTGPASFHTFTVPDQLKAIDAERLDRVVVSSQRLLGPLPYRGGDVDIDLGLFSVETSDLVDAYLGILTDLANAAGVGYVNAALPFVKPIENGVQRLLGANGPASLEIGLSKDLEAPREGLYVVMRASSTEMNQVKLDRDGEYKLRRRDGNKLEHPYMTFEVVATSARADWFAIEELRRPYSTLQEVVRSGNVKAARDQFVVFQHAVLTSPDLLFADAQSIVAKADGQLKAVLQTAATARAEELALPDLEMLTPFE